MMILSIIATVVLLSVLFYHRVSLFLSSLILLAWTAAQIHDLCAGVPRLP